jgi:nicotinamidase-related amidase
MSGHLLPLPLTERSVHLCIDMQRIFSADGPWPTPWMERVLPVVAALAGRHPERTVFTRFIPPERPEQMPGMWQRVDSPPPRPQHTDAHAHAHAREII